MAADELSFELAVVNVKLGLAAAFDVHGAINIQGELLEYVDQVVGIVN